VSLAVAVPLGVASAIVYGSSIVIQHDIAHAAGSGDEDPRGLLKLLRDPRWLMAIAGDFFGFLLQIGALATGSVVLVQPLVVLMLPVSLFVGYLLGGPRPRAGDYVGCIAVVGGLAVFLSLIGDPHSGHVPHAKQTATAVLIILVAGLLVCVVVNKGGRLLRGAAYGAVAGLYFGTLAVMVDAASDRFGRAGLHGLVATPRGLVPLIGIALLGLGGIILTQVSFQVGALAATLPANLAADPVTGVVFGAFLLREYVPTDGWHLAAYALCLCSVLAGTMRLAAPAAAAAQAAAAQATHT
jgi:drug/metabolite transporter (DMT)-like permease